jgi:hypothetical protein
MPFDAAPSRPNPAPAPGLDPGVDPGVACQLPADAYYHLIRTLCLTLPPPLTDNPDDLARRNHAAIARIAALVPANAAEADLAAMFVAASEQWKDCLRLAQVHEATPGIAAKCRAQSLSMMREAKSALRLLLKLQEVRAKREADNAGSEHAAWTEHCAIARMAEALAALPAAVPARPAMAEPPAPALQSKPEPMSAAARRAAMDLAPDRIAAAERYAATYPDRAAHIRRTGKMPPGDVRYFDPPEATLAGALIAGRTPALAALDRDFAEASAA